MGRKSVSSNKSIVPSRRSDDTLSPVRNAPDNRQPTIEKIARPMKTDRPSKTMSAIPEPMPMEQRITRPTSAAPVRAQYVAGRRAAERSSRAIICHRIIFGRPRGDWLGAAPMVYQ